MTHQENSLKVRLSKEISDKTRELRRISGEDLEGLSLEELEELEQKLEVGLNRVSETKDEQLRKEIATLQYKVANDRQTGGFVPGMDRMILDEDRLFGVHGAGNQIEHPSGIEEAPRLSHSLPTAADSRENSLKVRLSKEISDKTRELRRISGEDLEGLSLEELEELEQKLEVGLNRVSETKDEQLRKEIATLQYKVANDRQNGRIVPGMDRMILDEGQTSESITNNSTTQPPLQAAHCSDTLLKLGPRCGSGVGFALTKQPEQAQQWHLKRCTPTRPNSATDGGCKRVQSVKSHRNVRVVTLEVRSRRKRTRNLDIVPFEGHEGPSDVAVEAHREAVQEMEFGRFLELQIKVFPTELSYVLLNSYNPINSKLKLKDRLMVDIAEDDAMLDCKDGGVWFKRLFMVLVCSMFIETQQNGTVGIQVLYYLDDVLSIPRMNWCSFVMNVLMETSVEWLKERSFTLIALCYSSVIFLGHFQHL
nr:MPF2-like [Ipomoea batatas]